MSYIESPVEGIITGATYYRHNTSYFLTVKKPHINDQGGWGSKLLQVIAPLDVKWEWGQSVCVELNQLEGDPEKRPVYELVQEVNL